MSLPLALLLDTVETIGEPRIGARRFWTGREEMILRAAFPEGGLPACLEKLPGRSAGAIYQHAGALGLRAPAEAARGTPRLRYHSDDHIDSLIRRTYQANPDTGAVKRLARTINRPRTWIRGQAIKLGVAVPRFKTPPWLAAETEIIAENPHLGPAALRQRLWKAGFVRTETAIAVRLKRIGASTEDPDHYTARGLAKLFGVDTKVVTGWIEKGWLFAQRRGTARTEQQHGDQWWINRDHVRRFVTDSVAVIDFRKLDKVWFVELMAGSAPASSASCVWASAGTEDGALVLHPERRQALVGAAVIALTGLEYAVLELLLTREDKVVTREAFMRHIYGEGDRPEIKIVDVVICKLRRKLARAGWGGAIEKDWGLGYTLVRVPTPVAAIGV